MKNTDSPAKMTLQSIASEYQDETGCTDKEAVGAALTVAYMLAVVAGDQEAMKYFSARFNESQKKGERP